jgi:hypothetical protein
MAHDIAAAKKALGTGRLLGPIMSTTLSPMLLVACTTTSHELVGRTRPPLPAGEVRVYLEPVAGRYEKIAVVEASSRHSWSWTTEAQAEVVVDRLKSEAAKLGANAIQLEEISSGGGSAGVGVAPQATRDHASLGVGLDASGLLGSRHGRAVAIYIPPPGAAPAADPPVR